MARSFTLAQLRTAVQQRGGVENSYDLTTEVLNGFINSAAAELHDILRKKGDDALVTSSIFEVEAGLDAVDLPVNFYKERLLWIADASSPSGWRRMRTFTLDEAHRLGRATAADLRYRIQGGSIYFQSAIESRLQFQLFYVPWAPILTSDGDVLDGFNGYEELVVMMAWRKCVERQRLDTSGVDREIARLTARVSSSADGRNAEPFSLVPRGLAGDHDDDYGPFL